MNIYDAAIQMNANRNRNNHKTVPEQHLTNQLASGPNINVYVPLLFNTHGTIKVTTTAHSGK